MDAATLLTCCNDLGFVSATGPEEENMIGWRQLVGIVIVAIVFGRGL
jgi:hypothetical protein